MSRSVHDPQTTSSRGGTYALLLVLDAPTEQRVGRLGNIRFDSPFYLYFGSAFGPGGLRARLSHHLHRPGRLHWHVDYLRQAASVLAAWYSEDSARLECVWAEAASAFRGASLVPGFGSSDCRCPSHLLAVPRLPRAATFRRHVNALRPACAPIRQLHAQRPLSA